MKIFHSVHVSSKKYLHIMHREKFEVDFHQSFLSYSCRFNQNKKYYLQETNLKKSNSI